MAEFKGEMTVKDENGNDVTLTVSIEINEEISQEVKIEYISQVDGGPLMRPARPPRN